MGVEIYLLVLLPLKISLMCKSSCLCPLVSVIGPCHLPLSLISLFLCILKIHTDVSSSNLIASLPPFPWCISLSDSEKTALIVLNLVLPFSVLLYVTNLLIVQTGSFALTPAHL